ncbi:MAG: amidohydrolase family protein [Spirochaetes bacterium]|nr:amidohydrolase family protein [Spirochaetota bacterium]
MIIIDSHVHIGKMLNFDLTCEQVIASMKKYNIAWSIVSNLEGAEFGHQLEPIPQNKQITQLDLNKKVVDFVKAYPKHLKGMFWIKPAQEICDLELQKLYLENQEYLCGLKIHPYHSNLALTESRYQPYLDFAKQYNLPIAVHTSSDKNSLPQHVAEIGQDYPEIKFILVHLGLGTDNEDAINLIKKQENLYGDSTWVSYEKVIKAIKTCGSHKVLFGTDNPIDGVDTYFKYQSILHDLKKVFSDIELKNFYYRNAQQLFQL